MSIHVYSTGHRMLQAALTACSNLSYCTVGTLTVMRMGRYCVSGEGVRFQVTATVRRPMFATFYSSLTVIQASWIM